MIIICRWPGGYIHYQSFKTDLNQASPAMVTAAGSMAVPSPTINDGFLLIPQIQQDLNVGKAFTSEICGLSLGRRSE